MAIAYVSNRGSGNVNPASNATTASFSPNATCAAGDLVVLLVALKATTGRTLSSVSDNSGGGNSWQVDKTSINSTDSVGIASCVLAGQITSSTVITVTFSGSVGLVANLKYDIEEFSGVKTSSWFDVGASATGSGTNFTAGTTTSAAANDLSIGAWAGLATESSVTADGSSTAFGSVTSSSLSLVGEYALGVSGAQSRAMTAGTTVTWAGAQATYKIGSITNNQTLSVTVTCTGSIIKQTGKILSNTVTVNPTLMKQVGKLLTNTVTVTPSLIKSVGKILKQTVTVNPSIVTLKAKQCVMSVTVTVTGSFQKSIGKILSNTITVNPSLIKSIGKTLSRTVTAAPSMVKSVGKTLSQTVTANASMVSSLARACSMTVIVTVTPFITKSVGKILSQTVTVTGSFVKSIGKVLSVPVTVTGSFVKSIGKKLTNVVTVSPSLVKKISKTLSQTITVSPSISAHIAVIHAQAMTVIVTVTPLLGKCKHLFAGPVVESVKSVTAKVWSTITFNAFNKGSDSLNSIPQNTLSFGSQTQSPVTLTPAPVCDDDADD